MKKDTHPEYKKITIKLADGSTFETRSTMTDDEFESEVDSTNHPFYTGRRQYVDTAGRVEKFRRRYGKKEESEDDAAEEEAAEEKTAAKEASAKEEAVEDEAAEEEAEEEEATAKEE